MKILLLLMVVVNVEALGQFRSSSIAQPYTFDQPILAAPKRTFIPGLLADPTRSFKNLSPLMVTSSSYDWRMQNNFFWSGTVTTLSFNKGKFGTYYYWDVQGNLRGMRGFIDISGKNKRGLKLVFPWH
ncbi:MAG TPA: hypothetical protein VKQ08_08135 [Cyclobacteriaceae bacterium]|nr:hypothetical protein [Cyclobacteriaceae bacterium]